MNDTKKLTEQEIVEIELELDKLINELEVVSNKFDKLFVLRKNGNATTEDKRELGKLKKQSADLYWKIGVAKDLLS
jgi:hypothetical protein